MQAGAALVLATGFAQAQTVTSGQTGTNGQTAATHPKMVGYIAADGPPYRLEWTGSGGTFVQHAYAKEPEKRLPMEYLHAQAGPTGYSKHLAWFVARDTDAFNILWLYLDDAGTDFGCWLYKYPANQLTYQRFTGQYRFTPPAVTPAANLLDGISLHRPPHYAGPDFTFRDWTRENGTLAHLELFSPPPEGPIVGTTVAPTVGGALTVPKEGPLAGTSGALSSAAPTKAPNRLLNSLRVAPLHQIRVGEANGWRNGGWQELHCLAFDSADDPYYLILYSNETTGFVVDIKHAQTYTADFGAKVQFSPDNAGTQQADHSEGQGDLRVRRYDWHDFGLRSTQKHANAYTEVSLLGEFVGPNGKKVLIPGYWDSSNRWNLRFSPGLVGDWKWAARSNDPDLNGQGGSFECVAVDGNERAFFGVHPSRSYRRHFATREGKSVFPFALHDAVFNVTPDELRANASQAAGATADEAALPASQAAGATADEAALPASFTAFQKRVNGWAFRGVNRFVGGYLLDHDGFGAKTQANEGGLLFLDNSPDRPNPEFFHWMDRRIAYCTEHGIVPDIGFGWPSGGMFQKYTDVQLRRFWLSVLARYASMDVSWNLFGDDGQPLPEGTDARITAFAELTRLYDPGHHALTVIQKGPVGPDYRIVDAAAALGEAGRKLAPVPPPANSPAPVADYPWLDYVTLVGGDAKALDRFADLDKPIVVWEDNGLPGKREAVSAEITRRWMWETRMRGAYWVGSADSRTSADDPDVKMAADCAKFFRPRKWWRLEPHPEMLNGKEETPSERRRRKKIEEEALKAAGVVLTGDSAMPLLSVRKPSGPLFLLADPGREYVAYLERGGHVTIDLLDMPGHIRFIWFNPRTGKSEEQPDIQGGDYTTFVAPDNDDWVFSLSRH